MSVSDDGAVESHPSSCRRPRRRTAPACAPKRRRARALRDACIAVFPARGAAVVPALDWLSHRSLTRSRSPYVAEIAQIAASLGFSGVWLLNASYQWGCTARAGEQDGAPWLARTLDWPFRGLGHHTELAHMRGRCGDFVSVTWPGYVGVLTAMAPGRFGAALNQAPMWRRTRHRWLRPFDYAANALRASAAADRMPPDQLLRRAFEECRDYVAARRLLEETPVARPVIYTLVGCAANERCVIERTETGFVTREDDTCAANDWVPCRPGWEGRIGMRRFLVSSFADAAGYSRARRETLKQWNGAICRADFDWVRAAGAQSLYAACGRHGSGHRHFARRGLRHGRGQLPEPVTRRERGRDCFPQAA